VVARAYGTTNSEGAKVSLGSNKCVEAENAGKEKGDSDVAPMSWGIDKQKF